jgi:hypothetical protein
MLLEGENNMPFHIRAADLVSAPIRIPVAILLSFVALTGVILATRPDMMADVARVAMQLQ